MSWVSQWLAYSATSAAFVLGSLRFLPSKVVERAVGHYFDRHLDKLRHAQTAEIERFRAELAHLSDRGRRSNEREYEALITTWEAFVEAFFETTTFVVGFSSKPDLKTWPMRNLPSIWRSAGITLERKDASEKPTIQTLQSGR